MIFCVFKTIIIGTVELRECAFQSIAKPFGSAHGGGGRDKSDDGFISYLRIFPFDFFYLFFCERSISAGRLIRLDSHIFIRRSAEKKVYQSSNPNERIYFMPKSRLLIIHHFFSDFATLLLPPVFLRP